MLLLLLQTRQCLWLYLPIQPAKAVLERCSKSSALICNQRLLFSSGTDACTRSLYHHVCTRRLYHLAIMVWWPDDQQRRELGLRLELCHLTSNSAWRFYLLRNLQNILCGVWLVAPTAPPSIPLSLLPAHHCHCLELNDNELPPNSATLRLAHCCKWQMPANSTAFQVAAFEATMQILLLPFLPLYLFGNNILEIFTDKWIWFSNCYIQWNVGVYILILVYYVTASWGMRVWNHSLPFSILASSADLKRIQNPYNLFRDFGENKTFTTPSQDDARPRSGYDKLQEKLAKFQAAKARHHFRCLTKTFYFSESVRLTEILENCDGQFLQRWFCSVRSPCIIEAIHWSHPLHRAEIALLWKIGVRTCSIGRDIFIFSSVTLRLQCPCWKPTTCHRLVDILSRYDLFWWRVPKKIAFCLQRKSQFPCEMLFLRLDTGPNLRTSIFVDRWL